ncbi:MAG: ABC-ATPase domain-containing protein [Desulfatibacillaceae bacterium]
MAGIDDLAQKLRGIDGKGYKAYKEVAGAWEAGVCTLFIDHVQGDPFAAPSRIRLRVPAGQAGFPSDLFSCRVRRVAMEDYLARRVSEAVRRVARGRGRRGSGKSGALEVDAGGQEVLERTAMRVTPEWVEARMYCGLPAAGRKVLGQQAAGMLCEEMPEVAEQALTWANTPHAGAFEHVTCVENQEHIRDRLNDMGLVAFVADGANLPRAGGDTQLPMPRDHAVPFVSPERLRVSMDLPNPVGRTSGLEEGARTISGMGLPKGVTLIVGGGYHGKSTLLNALERGVYPRIPGDGREYVVCDSGAVKIRAEDGRSVRRVDIGPFITNLPDGTDTSAFSTDNASGSTSQATNIVEAVEAGARVLLLDEDTSATNFMIRDVRMQKLVSKSREPITPFVDRVRGLYEDAGVSTILVMGGSGDYFEAADTVVMMDGYRPVDVTSRARDVARQYQTGRQAEAPGEASWTFSRNPDPDSFDPSRGKRDVKIDIRGADVIRYGDTNVDLAAVPQLAEPSQTRAAAMAVYLATQLFMDGGTPLAAVLEALERQLDERGLDILDPYHRQGRHPGSFARPRMLEVAAAINRMRDMRVKAD